MLRIVLLAVASILVSGCFGPKFVYENADWLTLREVDKHFCPAGERRDAVRAEIQKVLKWHKRHELPKWIAALRRFAVALDNPDGLAEADLARFLDDVSDAWLRFTRKGAGPLSGWLRHVQPSELSCLETQMAVYRKESDERYAGTDAEYRERTIEKGVEWAERFLGDLSETQRATVTKMLDLDRDRAQAASRARLEANARFVAAMRKEGGEAGVRAVKAALKDPFALYSPEGKALVQARRAHFRTVLFAAAALMTREQRAELRIRVLSWTADLRAVAKGR